MDKQREFASLQLKEYMIRRLVTLQNQFTTSGYPTEWKDITSLLFPNPTSHPKLQFLPVSTREEKSHVSLNDETIKTVTHLSVAVPYAPRHSLPYHLPSIPTHFQAVAIVLCFIVITHKPQECYVDRGHTQLESFEM